MGSSSSQSAPYVPPPAPDPEAVAAEQLADNLNVQTTQTSLASQTASLTRVYGSGLLRPAGAAATGALNGMPSLAMAPLGSAALGAGR